jgi:hypothetical protein
MNPLNFEHKKGRFLILVPHVWDGDFGIAAKSFNSLFKNDYFGFLVREKHLLTLEYPFKNLWQISA